MRESIGYTATLNIAIIFITVIFAFIFVTLNYYRAYKVNNAIINEIEKYEGYNDLAKDSIKRKLYAYGYANTKMSCRRYTNGTNEMCSPTSKSSGDDGYCVYECTSTTSDGYIYYRVATNIFMNIPLIRNFINIPIYGSTNEMYDFEAKLGTVE